MQHNDKQYGRPAELYTDTKANVEAQTVSEGAIAFATDTNQLGTFNGSTWDWGVLSGGGGATDLDDLTDVVITSPATGQILKYNGTNWVNSAPGVWAPLTNGDTTSPELIFALGDVIMVEVFD